VTLHFLNRLSLWQKLTLLVGVLAIPTAVLGVLSFAQHSDRVRNIAALLAVAALFLGVWLTVLITRSMTRPMARVIAVLDAIQAGRYDSFIKPKGTDEGALVLRALDDMQTKLRRQIESERSAAEENARIRQALDSVTANVMVANDKYEIVYTNPAVHSMFRAAEADLRKDLPHFSASAVHGSSIDIFHKNPGHQRRMLDALRSVHRAEISVGGRSFALIANPIFAAGGERIGTVLEWNDRTQEISVEKELQDMLADVLAGKLHKRLELQGKTGFFEVLGKGVNELADNMVRLVARVQSTATEVVRGAEEISTGSASLSQRTAEQSSSLQETASSMEQMTSTVKQNADNASQASALATAARDQATQGSQVVSRAVQAMSSINEASQRIADIIGLIDEIAFQTNLLALNAAVEAARAGEQGRGFAVVASEVRGLAGRSATAAKEIKDLIQDSVKKVEDGSVLVAQSGQTLDEIVSSVKKVSDIIAEIAAASREQSAGIDQVNRAIMQMDQMTQQNAALVEEAAASSQGMADQARRLTEMMAHYQVDTSHPNSSPSYQRAA
jgi:methyl-accepting chemotaxis protein